MKVWYNHAIFTVDLPKLSTIFFEGEMILRGDVGDHCKVMINGHESFGNTLLMRGMLKLKFDMKEFWCRSDL